MQASIIIPAYHEQDTIRQTLRDLIDSVRQTDWAYEIIIVDSSEDDETTDNVTAFKEQTGAPISILRPGEKTYAGKARNQGVAQSRHELIVFLDVGVYVAPDWFARLAEPFVQSPDVDLVWGRSIYRPQSVWERAYVRSFHRSDYSRRFIRSAMMKKSVFQQLGGFIEHVHAGEDLDFYQRIAKVSYREVFADDAISYYTHFPQNTRQMLQKWIAFTRDNVLAGQARKKTVFILAELLLLLLCLFLFICCGWPWGTGLLLLLVAGRVVFQFVKADIPMQHSLEMPLTVYLIAVFDTARILGVFYGWFCQISNRYTV